METVLLVTAAAVIFLFAATLMDVQLFTDKKKRHLVYTENKLPRTPEQIFKVYLGLNATEIGLFLVGFWAASFLAWGGWL